MNRLVGLLPTSRTRKVVSVLLATFLVLAAGAVAIAAPSGLLTPGAAAPQQGLVAVGPVNASNGFPDWYRDSNGIDLMPCNDPQDKYCGGAVPAPDPTQPPTFPGNFPAEFFYQQAGADSLVNAGGNNVLAEFNLEGAFANGPVTNGDQVVFSRIRYRIDAGLKSDTDYKITSPYGTDTVHTDPTAARSGRAARPAPSMATGTVTEPPLDDVTVTWSGGASVAMSTEPALPRALLYPSTVRFVGASWPSLDEAWTCSTSPPPEAVVWYTAEAVSESTSFTFLTVCGESPRLMTSTVVGRPPPPSTRAM